MGGEKRGEGIEEKGRGKWRGDKWKRTVERREVRGERTVEKREEVKEDIDCVEEWQCIVAA